jgi:hypothetical protein
MTNLFPAAQAVLDATWKELDYAPRSHAQIAAAAALRAAVAYTQQHHGHDVWECDANEILAIAAELEKQ